MQFLKIKPSARAASLGDGFVSIANDVNAVFYNPAGLTRLNAMEISLMHMVYLADTNYEYGAMVLPVGDKLRIGAYVVYLNYGSIGRSTEDGSGLYMVGTDSYTPYDFAGAVSLGYKINDFLSVGVNAKLGISEVAGSSLSGLMGDAGVLVKLTETMNFGGAIYNVGGSSAGGSSPINGRAGISTKLSAMEKEDLTVAVGVNYTRASGVFSGSIGAEYYEKSIFSLRAGYGTAEADGINVGAGVRQSFGDMTGTLDYNFAMLGDMGSAHRISLGVKFGKEGGGTKSSTPGTKNKGYSIRKRF
jgi:hypothetical protein